MSARDDYPNLATVENEIDPRDGSEQAEATAALDELDVLRHLVADMADEMKDIRSQWGNEYLWTKYNQGTVVDLLDRAAAVKP